MNLLNLIDRIEEEKLDPFIAPVMEADRVEIFTLSEMGTPYRFTVKGDNPGWYLIEPQDAKRAVIGRPAYPFETIRYLEALPRFYVIVLFRLANLTWLCIPYNASDAQQRGWANGEPRPVHLVTGSVKPFDVLDTRLLVNTLLYNTVSTKIASHGRAMRNAIFSGSKMPDFGGSFKIAFQIVRQRQEELRLEAQRRALARRRVTVEDRLRFHLDFMNAELSGWSEEGDGYRVRWTFEGKEFEARLRKDLHVISAGVPGRAICLGHGGEETRQNLSGIVEVMRQACEIKRWDLPESYKE